MLSETLNNIIVPANAVVQRGFARKPSKNKEYPQDISGTVWGMPHSAK
jgi:hypothetical protein